MLVYWEILGKVNTLASINPYFFKNWIVFALNHNLSALPTVSPVGLLRPFPCCLLLASLRMSMMSVANSRALKRASFWRPWKREGQKRSSQQLRVYCYNTCTCWHDGLKFSENHLKFYIKLCSIQKQSSPHSVVHCLSDCCGQLPWAVEKHSHAEYSTHTQIHKNIHHCNCVHTSTNLRDEKSTMQLH